MANIDTIRNLYASFAQGDIQAFLDLLDPAVEWTDAEGYPYGGTYVGPQAVMDGVITPLGTEWDGYRVDIDEFLDAGDSIVALGHNSGTYRPTGKSMRAVLANIWTLKNGKIVKFVQYVDTVKVAEAL